MSSGVASHFDNSKYEIYCPECGSPIMITGKDIRLELTVKCTSCGIDIKLNDHNDEFKKLYKEAKSLDETIKSS